MQPLRLLLVDDHALFREGLIALLSYQDNFTVVGEADDAESALEQARALEPDIVLMDIELPGEDGVIATSISRPALVPNRVKTTRTQSGPGLPTYTLHHPAASCSTSATFSSAF